MDRLTIKDGKLSFYNKVETKCSNKNAPHIKKQVKQGIPYYAIKDYKTKSYKDEELSEIYQKLAKLEDLMEKYGIESVEELDKLINVWKLRDVVDKMEKPINNLYEESGCIDLEKDRDTWKKACELACGHIAQVEWLSSPETDDVDESTQEIRTITKQNITYFYKQAQEEMKNGTNHTNVIRGE